MSVIIYDIVFEIRCLLPGKKVFHVDSGNQVSAPWQKVFHVNGGNQVSAPWQKGFPC